MSSACVTTPHCGYCGRPIVGASVWSLCAVYHPECTRGPSFDTGLGYEFPPAPDHRDAEIARLRAELAEAEARGYRRAVEDARKAVLALDTGKSAGRDLSYNLAVRRGADAISALGERE